MSATVKITNLQARKLKILAREMHQLDMPDPACSTFRDMVLELIHILSPSPPEAHIVKWDKNKAAMPSKGVAIGALLETK